MVRPAGGRRHQDREPLQGEPAHRQGERRERLGARSEPILEPAPTRLVLDPRSQPGREEAGDQVRERDHYELKDDAGDQQLARQPRERAA
jgi:hypothetical protein